MVNPLSGLRRVPCTTLVAARTKGKIMATVEEGLQAQIRNIEAAYGKPLQEWFAMIAASGKTKHTDVVAMLKTEHGMTHGAAHRVSLLSRQPAGQQLAANVGADPVGSLYAGKKVVLRPIHDALMRHVRAFGDDVEFAPRRVISVCGAGHSSR